MYRVVSNVEPGDPPHMFEARVVYGFGMMTEVVAMFRTLAQATEYAAWMNERDAR